MTTPPTPPTPPTDNLAAEGGPRSEMSEQEALAAEIEEVLRENMSRGTSGRYIVSYGITPEDFADALADLLAARDRRVRAEALREAAEAWPFEVNAETIRREIATLDLRETPREYRVDQWLRDRAGRIEAP